jgi:recombination protein RecA
MKPKAEKSIQRLLIDINKKYGEGTIIAGSEIRDDLIGFITTGSLSLDGILGGGWPLNQWAELIGEASHGKTAIALKTIAANQVLDPDFTTVWVAAEQWVPDYAQMLGVDLSRVFVISTNIMEEAYEAVIQITQSKAVDCIVIDSLPALVPMAEDEKEMEEFTVGRGALQTNKFFRKVGIASKRSLTKNERPFIGIIINQWRSKVGGYGDPKTTPGGQGKDYAFFTRLEVKRDEWIEISVEGQKDKAKVGQTIKVKTIKNKVTPPNQVAYIDYYFANGGACTAGDYDFGKQIASLGVMHRVIERKGGWYYYGENKWQGSDAMIAQLREDINLKETLEKEVLQTIKAGSKFAVETEDEE